MRACCYSTRGIHSWLRWPELNEFVFVRNAEGVQAVPVTVVSRAIDQVIVQGALTAKQSIAVQGLASLKGMWLGLGTTGTETK